MFDLWVETAATRTQKKNGIQNEIVIGTISIKYDFCIILLGIASKHNVDNEIVKQSNPPPPIVIYRGIDFIDLIIQNW